MPLLQVVAAFAIASTRTQTSQAGGPLAEDPGIDFLLLDVMYDHLRLETALPALQDAHGRRFLPLKQLAVALGFRIHVEPHKRVAGGFLGDPSDRIAVNGLTGKCVHKGKDLLFDGTLCFERDNDLYLESGLIAKFMGLHFDWIMNKLELDVTSDAPLPIQQQWMQRQALDRREKPSLNPHLPIVRSPYSLWSIPSLDMQLYTNAIEQSKVAESTSRLQVEGRGDLLFMSARYRYISGSGADPPATLLTLGREDPHAGLLGPLQATQVSFGDLNLAQVPLFAVARNGLGATISNLPVGGTQTGMPAQLEGHAPARSTVELYRGSELLSTIRADERGHYVFSSIPLENGPNDLRIVVITPEGDVQEDQRTLYGDASGPPPGQTQYRLTAARVGDSLFSRGLPGISQQQARTEYVGEYRLGLTDHSWLATTAAEADGEGFLGLGLHSWGGGSLWHLDSMLSANGGSAISAGFSRKLGNATFSFDHTIASRAFGADLVPEIGTDATSITRLRLDGSTGGGGHPVGYGLSIDRMNGPSPQTLLRGRLNGISGGTFYANTVAVRLSNQPLDGTGLFQARRQIGSSIGRLDIGYGFGSEKPFQSMLLTLDHRISGDYRMRAGLDYDVTRAGGLETISTVYRMLGPLELGLDLAVDARGALKANILLSVGFEGEQNMHTMSLARPGAAQTGSVEARVYLDRNFNGRFDKGDVLLSNVGLTVGGRPAIAKTGHDGICYLDRLASNQEVTVALNPDSLEDPSWAPSSPGFLVVPRAGHLVHVDFGVIEAAEIEGRVSGPVPPRLGLTAELRDSHGLVIQTSVLDDDNTYVFSQIPPGDYTLRLVDASGQAHGARLVRVAAGASIKDCDVLFASPSKS